MNTNNTDVKKLESALAEVERSLATEYDELRKSLVRELWHLGAQLVDEAMRLDQNIHRKPAAIDDMGSTSVEIGKLIALCTQMDAHMQLVAELSVAVRNILAVEQSSTSPKNRSQPQGEVGL